MFRLDYPEYESGQFSIEEASLLPDETEFSSELKQADSLLRDPKFEEPFIKKHSVAIGRAGIPLRPYLRLMYLKYINSWGYEPLIQQVSDSLPLRRFCRIPIDGQLPHSSTLIRLNRKYGEIRLKKIFFSVNKKISRRDTIPGREEINPIKKFFHSAAEIIKKTIKSGRQ